MFVKNRKTKVIQSNLTCIVVNREMNTTLNDCNMKLSGATKFICQMNKFVDRARRFIKIQKAIQCIEFYIRTYDSLHRNNREILEKKIDKAIQFIQRFTKFRMKDLVVVDKLLDVGLSLDSDCDEIIDNRGDFLAVYHNKLQKKRYMQRENINKEKIT